MVSGYSGFGMHVFISAGVVDTSVFKGVAEVTKDFPNISVFAGLPMIVLPIRAM